MIDIQGIINKYGESTARAYLYTHFQRDEGILDFKCLFPNHLSSKSPPFHDEILTEIPKGGKQAYGAPRGFAKSTTIDVVGASWLAVNSRYHFILIISDTYTQAKMHLGSLKAELETNEYLKWLYGDLRGDTWGEDTIIVNGIHGQVMIMALGAGMKIRGLKFKQYRPELAIIDDLENTEMVYNAERRKKLQRWLDFDLIPALGKPKNVIYLGTILHYHALLKKILFKEGKYQSWKTKIFKAIMNGQSLWKDRYSLEYLVAIRDDPSHPDYVGSIVFAQEYMNEPQDDKDRIIKLDWIKEYSFKGAVMQSEGVHEVNKLENFLKKLTIVAGVDPAISEKETADNFSMYVMGWDEKDTGNEYMIDLLHGKYTIDDQVERIVDLCIQWDIEICGIESNAYQAGLYDLVKKEAAKRGCKTKFKKIITDKDKIRRARIHSSAFEGGFIKLRTDHPKTDILRTEIEEFPLGEHDDAFDSLMLAREVRQKPKPKAYTHKLKGF